MAENNLWIIALATVGIIAILALFGMVSMTGYAEKTSEIHSECIDEATTWHKEALQNCGSDSSCILNINEEFRNLMEYCINEYVELGAEHGTEVH